MSALAVFLASLLGSLHCVGMCGGFVACVAGDSKRSWKPHLAYNFGRLITYTCLGAAAGALGGALNNTAAMAGINQGAAILTGLLLIYWGARGLLAPGNSHLGSEWLYKKVRKLFGFALTPNPEKPAVTTRSFVLGLLSTLLPCGWLYAFVALAAASGSALSGSLLMLFFWLGTVPALLALGAATKFLSKPLLQWAPRMTAVLLVAAGIYSLSGHSFAPMNSHSGHHHSHPLPIPKQ